ARELDALVAEIAGLAAHVFKWKVGPLASEKRDGTGHAWLLRMESWNCLKGEFEQEETEGTENEYCVGRSRNCKNSDSAEFLRIQLRLIRSEFVRIELRNFNHSPFPLFPPVKKSGVSNVIIAL